MTSVFQKPDAIDKPTTTVVASPTTTESTPIVYDKPNAYDEKPPVVITASRHGSRSSRITVDSFSSRYFQKNNPSIIRHSSTASSTSCSSTIPYTPVESPPLSPTRRSYNSQIDKHITSYILSQSTPTIQTTLAGHEDEIPFHYIRPSSPANSVVGDCASKNHATDIVAAVAALLSNDSGIVSSFFLQNRPTRRQHHHTHKKQTNNNNVIVYNFKKASVFKPNQHHIYLHIEHEEDEEDVLAYRKIQPGSSFGGLHSILYSNRNDGQGIKVAEARRRAFQKNITIESGDYEDTLVDDITQTYIPNSKLRAPATQNMYCQDLVKRSQSNILFEYETWFHGSRMRWTRPSLLSHDFTCEIKLTKVHHHQVRGGRRDEGFIDSDSDDDEDDHDHHSHRTCRRWKLVAEFDSHNLNFLNQNLGTLSIDLDILNQVESERCDLLEANIVMTCSTLIDLIREIMGKR